MAKEVGKGLGSGSVLLEEMPWRAQLNPKELDFGTSWSKDESDTSKSTDR
jgi:hypothetical protein